MIREPLKYIFGRINAFVPANADPESVEVRCSERRYDAPDAVMPVSRTPESLRNDVKPVAERIVDENQILWSVRGLPEKLLDGRASHVHEGFYGQVAGDEGIAQAG